MSEIHTVEILKSACGVLELRPGSIRRCTKRNIIVRASFSGLAWSFSPKKSTMVPFSIHGVTVVYSLSSIVAPTSFNTFGWDRCFQVATSWQKFCGSSGSIVVRRTANVSYLFYFPDVG